jgi:hypothetical protein
MLICLRYWLSIMRGAAVRRLAGICFLLLVGVAACASADVTSVRQNLNKYWLYRNKQRTDFLVPGIGQGYSLLANTRNPDTHLMWWGDATIDLGWYIGALATEHYMLTHPELFPGYVSGGGDLNQVRNELYYAILAMDRVDATAEACWNPTAPDTPGFFIRDDVPSGFLSHFPGMTVLGSDFTNPDVWAKEMSQDQVCHVLIGLALVKKLIPADLVVDGVNLRQHAITRGSNIVDWVHQAGWMIKNPVLGTDVVRGPDARSYSTGFNKTCVYLTDGSVDFGGSISGLWSFVWGTLSSPTNPAYDNANNLHMAMSIAATGNGWGNDTLDDLMSLAAKHQWYAYVLLYATLYDSTAQSRPTWLGHQQTFSGLVQTMLNQAPSNATPHHPNNPGEQNTGWCASRKFIRGLDTQNSGEGAVGDQWPGLDYLLLHNLHYIVTPALWQDPSPSSPATNPNPANGATGVSAGNPTLTWTAGSSATSHDVYFGTSNPPAFRQNQAGATYSAGSLSEDTLYYWRIDEKNAVGTTTGAVWSFRTSGAPPGPVTGFSATGSAYKNTLSWTNPASDFAGTKILYKTTGYPSSSSDGTILYSGTTATCTHTGIAGGTTYYYAAYAYDAAQNYSTRTTTSLLSSSPYCYADDFTYPYSNLRGNGIWTNGAAAAEIQAWVGGTVKIIGGSSAAECYGSVQSCSGVGGVIWVRIQAKKGSGTSTMWSFYIDDAAGNRLARWYGAGTTAKGRIGTTSLVTADRNLTGPTAWDNLDAKIYTATNQTEFFFNGSSLGTLDHSSTGAGDTVGRLKFERIYNSAAGEYIYLDNLSVGAPSPPGSVTSFTVVPGNQRNNLMWTNPTDSDFAGVKILFKTSGYPTSVSDGSQCYVGTGSNCVHTGLTNGSAYYYSAFAFDDVPNYSTKADSSATPIYVDAKQAKLAANAADLTLTAGVISAAFADFFYVQSADSPELPIGIRVDKAGHGLAQGLTVGASRGRD